MVETEGFDDVLQNQFSDWASSFSPPFSTALASRSRRVRALTDVAISSDGAGGAFGAKCSLDGSETLFEHRCPGVDEDEGKGG